MKVSEGELEPFESTCCSSHGRGLATNELWSLWIVDGVEVGLSGLSGLDLHVTQQWRGQEVDGGWTVDGKMEEEANKDAGADALMDG